MLHRNKYLVIWLIAMFVFTLNGPAFSRGKKKKYGETTILCKKGHQNPTGTKYCIVCGEPVAAKAEFAYCPEGHKNPADAKFCQVCGKKVVQAVIEEKADYTICAKGHKNPTDAKFCKVCGKEVKPPEAGKDVLHCPEGHLNPKEATFCQLCGKKIVKKLARSRISSKRSEPKPDMSKERGKWPVIINIGFFALVGIALIIASNSADAQSN